ncbi:MAG: hypothetical protein EBW08_03660 [Pelagibacteraceae bacterium]|nr:hypothetical protein [Pelagibacteraceae bacterium]
MDVVVTSAPRLEVPDTANVDRLVAAPSRSTLPVMVKAFVPPARVDPKLTVVPVKILSPPDKVTAPEYVWVDDVVTSAPRLEVPSTVKLVNEVAAPSRSKAPEIVRLSQIEPLNQ